MITATFTPTSLTLKGHAGHGKKGHDVVCAAASAYLHQLIGVLALEEKAGAVEGTQVRTAPGDAEVICEPSTQAKAAIQYCKVGFLLLASQYPDYVTIIG